MKPNGNNNSNIDPFSRDVRQWLNEAEVYANHGLFAEAKETYRKILDGCGEKTNGEAEGNPASVDAKLVRHVENKIIEIELWENAFRPDPVAQEARSESERGSLLFTKGLAFKNIGLFDEALTHFKNAAKRNFRRMECLEEIGSTLVQKGRISEGLAVFRKVYCHPETGETQKSRILESIAAAREQAESNMLEAGNVYEELVSLEDSFRDEAKAESEKEPVKKKLDFSTVTARRWLFLILSSLVAIFFTAFNPFVKIVDNVDYFMVEGNPDALFYDHFKEIFGEDDFFVIAFEATDLFTARNLATIANITEDLEKLDEIRDVTSLSNVDDIIGEEDYFEIRSFIDEIPEDYGSLQALKDAAIRNPLYRGGLISEDGNTAAIFVETYEGATDPEYKKNLVEKTRDLLKKYEKEGFRFHLAGPVFTNFTLSQYMNRDMGIFIPITYLLITVTIWLFFRNIPLTVAALVNISVCVGATRGFMGLTGLTLNNVTSIVVPLVMALSLCDTVHIFSHMDKRIADEMPDRFQALGVVLNRIALPCFLTTLTTAVGFVSLSVSQIPAIREFAWIASAGMVFEFFFSFFFLPPLLLFFSPSKIYQDGGSRSGITRVLHRVAIMVERKRVLVLVASLIVVGLAVFYANQIKVETNMMEFFKEESTIRTATDFVETRLSGVNTFDISLKADYENAFKDPQNLQIIENIQKFLESRKKVDKTLSFVDFLKDMNESFHNENEAWFRVPDSREMVAQYLLLYDSEEIEDFVNSTFDHARISIRISEHSSLLQKKLIDDVRKFIEGLENNKLAIRVTGRTVNEINIIDDLVRGQILSLSMAALIISFVMLFVFKSVSMALLSMLPNFFPIIANFGIMGFFHIPLDTGTALIAAVALGIAVDDTIHLLSAYQERRVKGTSVSQSIKDAVLTKGRAILSSSIILSIGFGVLILSRFVPIMHFGFLTSVIMLTAVVGDLIVLPAIINIKKSKNEDPALSV